MTTECNQFVFGFHPQKRREIRAQFDGGAITSDGGGLLLREVEKRVGILRQFAACFTDYRNPDLIEHQVEEMVAQRVYGLALRYEDLNDHEELRNDPLLAVLVEMEDPGSVMSGAPYGYHYIRKTDEAPAAYVIDEAKARVVYEMYTGEGLSIKEITRRLNTEGVPARRAIRWERSVVWGVLRNPAYRGIVCFGKTRISARTRVMRPQRRRGTTT
jgi:Transposase DDE domain group 1/Recombinase